MDVPEPQDCRYGSIPEPSPFQIMPIPSMLSKERGNHFLSEAASVFFDNLVRMRRGSVTMWTFLQGPSVKTPIAWRS